MNVCGVCEGKDACITGTGKLELVSGNFGFGFPNNCEGAGAGAIGRKFEFAGGEEIAIFTPFLSCDSGSSSGKLSVGSF